MKGGTLKHLQSGPCGRGTLLTPTKYLPLNKFLIHGGDTSGSSQPPVDVKTSVEFQYMLLIIVDNFCFEVNGRLGTT